MWQLGDCRRPAYSQSSALLFIIVIIIIITSVYKIVFLSFFSPRTITPSFFIPFCLHDVFKNQQSRKASPCWLPHSDPWLLTPSSLCRDWICIFEPASRRKHPGSVYPPDITNYAQGQKTKLTSPQCVWGIRWVGLLSIQLRFRLLTPK